VSLCLCVFLPSLKDELQRQLHDSRILRRQDFSEVRIVDCRNGNSRTVAICQVKGLNTRLDAHILLKPEDSRQSRIDPPKAGARKSGPPCIAERAEDGLRKCSWIEPAPWIRVFTKRIDKQPVGPLSTATRAGQLAVDTGSRSHESARQYAITRRQPPVRGKHIQSAVGEVRRGQNGTDVRDVPPVERIRGVRVECRCLAIGPIEVTVSRIKIPSADAADV